MNPEQLRAVLKTDGPLLLLAGAGSGKTTVLVNRIANLCKYGSAYYSDEIFGRVTDETLRELDSALAVGELSPPTAKMLAVSPARPWEILAITFTNKAAGELKERLKRLLGDGGRDIWASTFHSCCARILRQYGERLGFSSHFTVYDTDDSRRLMKDCMRRLDIDEKKISHREILSEISRQKDSLVDPAEFTRQAGSDFRLRHAARAYELYQKSLKEADAMDFDDLLFNTVRLFQTAPDVLERYWNKFRYILVDEYQDTNHAQYVMVKMLAEKHKNICVVGDDDQSIYAFRGATIENILSFEEQYKGCETIRLEQNYRSTGVILDAANAIINHNIGRKGKTLWTENARGETVLCHTAQDEQEEARFVADSILENIRNGRKPSEHAVLYRMNAQSNAVESVLARSGVPYRVIGGVRFYDRREIKDMLAYLCVVNNPDDSLRLKRIINVPKRGIGETTVTVAEELAIARGISLFEIISHAEEYAGLSRAAVKLTEFAKLITDLREKLDLPIHELFSNVLDKSRYLIALAAQGDEGKDRIDNVNELSSSILQYEKETSEPTLAGFLEEVALVTDLDSLDQTEDRAVLMTVHAAKGLEFPFVYIIGAEEGVFPGNRVLYAPAELEEERRLMYVAVTRAKEKLTITNAYTRMLHGQTGHNQPSRFVNEIPGDLMVCDRQSLGYLGRKQEPDDHFTIEDDCNPNVRGGQTAGVARPFNTGNGRAGITFGKIQSSP
ncbi:MAG: UvrD-helicase domain-containing protein, partial [Oscillospiraceae bacterium]|nr:UvrD-helicase domain-containing protein [Oscillospiraceae bacterium]